MSNRPPKPVFDARSPSYTTPLPRDPLVPREFTDSDHPDVNVRDTQRIPEQSGEHAVSDDDSEKTPLESIYSLKAVSGKLDEVLAASLSAGKAAADAANESIATRSAVGTLTDALKALAKRVTALEVSGRWAPLTLSAIALVAVFWLAFQVQQLQMQLQLLRH